MSRDDKLRRRTEDPARLNVQLESAEAAHLWAGAVIVPYVVYAFAAGIWRTAICFTIVQVLGNAYPIMHLRVVRSRVDRYASTISVRRARVHGSPPATNPPARPWRS
ncbi:MAG: hypothetical protein ACHP91_00490 [Burkholderiales bacterium]